MAYTAPYTFTALELLTAAKMNAIQDNVSALWVGTTAGDTDYYASSSSKGRIAIGSAYQIKRVSSGIPAWTDMFERVILYKSADQTFSTGSVANITWETEATDVNGWHAASAAAVIPTVTGLYLPFVSIYFNKNTGGSGNCHLTSRIQKNGTDTANKITITETIDANTKMFTYGGLPTSVTAGESLTVTFVHDMGADGKIISGAFYTQFAVLRIG